MTPQNLLGAVLVERVGSSSKGFVSIYEHATHGVCVMRQRGSEQRIYLERNVPAGDLAFLADMRERAGNVWIRRNAGRGDARDRV